jgi:hypothetical protein
MRIGMQGLMIKNLKKFTAEKNIFFISKIRKGRPSLRRILHPSKDSSSKHVISKLLSIFVVHFCVPGTVFPMRIWIRIQPTNINPDPEPKHCFVGKFLQKIIRQRFQAFIKL